MIISFDSTEKSVSIAKIFISKIPLNQVEGIYINEEHGRIVVKVDWQARIITEQTISRVRR